MHQSLDLFANVYLELILIMRGIRQIHHARERGKQRQLCPMLNVNWFCRRSEPQSKCPAKQTLADEETRTVLSQD